MKIKIGTIILILIISLSALMGFRQYQMDESAKKITESEPQTEVSWNIPYGTTLIRVSTVMGILYRIRISSADLVRKEKYSEEICQHNYFYIYYSNISINGS